MASGRQRSKHKKHGGTSNTEVPPAVGSMSPVSPHAGSMWHMARRRRAWTTICQLIRSCICYPRAVFPVLVVSLSLCVFLLPAYFAYFVYVRPIDDAFDLVRTMEERIRKARTDEDIVALVPQLRKALDIVSRAQLAADHPFEVFPKPEGLSHDNPHKKLFELDKKATDLLKVAADRIIARARRRYIPEGAVPRLAGLRDLFLLAEQYLEPHVQRWFSPSVFPANVAQRGLLPTQLNVLNTLGNFAKLATFGNEKLIALMPKGEMRFNFFPPYAFGRSILGRRVRIF